jgi:hypothetical protein
MYKYRIRLPRCNQYVGLIDGLDPYSNKKISAKTDIWEYTKRQTRTLPSPKPLSKVAGTKVCKEEVNPEPPGSTLALPLSR